jgi:uncharacterized membrane protein
MGFHAATGAAAAAVQAEAFGDVDKQATALTLFVGIPLPGTGAWTGAMIASLLGMSTPKVCPKCYVYTL